MFTGLVDHVARVVGVGRAGAGLILRVESEFRDFQVGESIACDGVCLTVERWTGGTFEVTAGDETLRVTTLGGVRVGDGIHVERALRLGDRLGGHMVQGHVDAVGDVVAVVPESASTRIAIAVPDAIARYIAPKGSVTVDGVSLTVNSVGMTDGRQQFSVGLIPHTLAVTKLGQVRPGSRLNIETDLLARYLERLLGAPGSTPPVGVGADLLRRSGFTP